MQPRCFGGYEFDLPDFLRVMMAVSRGCAESGLVLVQPFHSRYLEQEFQRDFGQAQALIDTAAAALLKMAEDYMEHARQHLEEGAPLTDELERRLILIEQHVIRLAWEAVELTFRTSGTSAANKSAPSGRYWRNLGVIRTHVTLQFDHTATNAARLHFGLPWFSRFEPASYNGSHWSVPMKTIALFGLLAILALAAGAQTTPPIPRTADGKPDLSGVWQGGNLAFAIGAERAKAEQSAAPPPAAARREPPPYQPWAAAKVQEYVDRKAIDDPMARCLLIGVPRITSSPMPMQIAQMPGQVIFLYETFHAFRVVPTDGRRHPDDIDSSFMGDSVGHWEADTLVVDVVGFNDKTWLAGVGSFHSEALHVTERYTRASYNTIAYDVTLEDPKVFTKPWNIHSNIWLRPGERLREYECAENNEDILRFESILKHDTAGEK